MDGRRKPQRTVNMHTPTVKNFVLSSLQQQGGGVALGQHPPAAAAASTTLPLALGAPLCAQYQAVQQACVHREE